MRILYLSRWAPYPADNGAKIRIFNSIRALAERHDVSLLGFGEVGGRDPLEPSEGMRGYCSRVQLLPYRGFRPGNLTAIRAFASTRPRSVVDTFSAEMHSAVLSEVRRHRPDLIVASQLDMVEYAMAAPDVPAILEELELAVYRDPIHRGASVRQRLRAGLTWLKLRSYLRPRLRRFRACTVVSKREQANVRSLAPGYSNVFVIPNAVDVASYAGDFGHVVPNTLVYAGALTYYANADAVQYLIKHIFLLIQTELHDAHLNVTGSTDGVDLGDLTTHNGVSFTGHLHDVRPIIATSAVSVVPLRLGGGTRLKILESMALGTPVVSTRKGAEGLEVHDGENILLADTSTEFANRVIQLLKSPEHRARIASGGRELVREKYDWNIVGTSLRTIVEVAASPDAHFSLDIP